MPLTAAAFFGVVNNREQFAGDFSTASRTEPSSTSGRIE
jgi:hypothetical protein